MFRFISIPFVLMCCQSTSGTMLLAGEETHTLRPGEPAPQLHFRLLADNAAEPKLETLRGKVVVLEFWATWCQPCVQAFPHINQLKEAVSDLPITFYSISYEGRDKVAGFLKRHRLTSEVGLDREFATFRNYLAWGIPMAVLIGKDGKVAATVNPSDLTAEHLRQLAAGKVPEIAAHPGWPDAKGAEAYFRAMLSEN